MPRTLLNCVLVLAVLLLVTAAYGAWIMRASLPVLAGRMVLPGLDRQVSVSSDRFGIPTINATSRLDAFRALGFVSARDRLFQMDLSRRNTAGELAEIFGARMISRDSRQRTLGLNKAASAILKQLPEAHRAVLAAYAEGVNGYLAQARTLPYEFHLLGYTPAPWKMTDSLLVALGMYEKLTWTEDERMLNVMQANLPPEVVAFLTPDSDVYTDQLLGAGASHHPAQPIPVAALTALKRPVAPAQQANLVQLQDKPIGSNAWAVAAAQTRTGHAMIANDMHLDISIPNIWYRFELRYPGAALNGLGLPGVPLLVVGSNGHVAWGFTNVGGDFVDLVRLETTGEDSEEYLTPQGWKLFETHHETIRVKFARDVTLAVKTTIWGPLMDRPGAPPHAVHWTALDPRATNLDLLEMDRVTTLDEAIEVMNGVGMPPQNVSLADSSGRIAWTLAGKFPLRREFDGSTSQSWASGRFGWQGFIEGSHLPGNIDPPGGISVTANNRTLGRDYPHALGRNYASGYRAWRIKQRLLATPNITAQDMLAIALDTRTQFYDFYHRLALSVLGDAAVQQKPALAELRDYLRAWNGRADPESLGLPLLVEFRKTLAETVFAPYLAACRAADAEFSYRWATIDTPLQAMLTQKIPQLSPGAAESASGWDAFILATLETSAERLLKQHQATSLTNIRWAETQRSEIPHPLSRLLPVLSQWLNLPQYDRAGCSHCVRVASAGHGASERLVVAAGNEEDGILHMPGGQSAHPLSPHYADQHVYWGQGLALPFLAGAARHMLVLNPDNE